MASATKGNDVQPVIKDGQPLWIQAGGVWVPAWADDPCDCCEEVGVPGCCCDSLPTSLTVSVSGLVTVGSNFYSCDFGGTQIRCEDLNGSYVCDHQGGCVWSYAEQIPGNCWVTANVIMSTASGGNCSMFTSVSLRPAEFSSFFHFQINGTVIFSAATCDLGADTTPNCVAGSFQICNCSAAVISVSV